MDAAKVLRTIDAFKKTHAHRRSEFTLPSAVHEGHELTVRRLDENKRGVDTCDLHFLMHAQVAPGTTKTLKNYSGTPSNKFVVYMSAEPGGIGRPPSPVTPPRKSSWVQLGRGLHQEAGYWTKPVADIGKGPAGEGVASKPTINNTTLRLT